MYRDLLYASPGLKPDAIGDYFKDASFGAKPEDIVSTENPLIPWQNRPTFQQVVEVQDHRPR
jgi:hypothetical protein